METEEKSYVSEAREQSELKEKARHPSSRSDWIELDGIQYRDAIRPQE